MVTPENTIIDTDAVVAHAQSQPSKKATPERTADKRAEAIRAKKKQKRAAHRVALRRSHTGG